MLGKSLRLPYQTLSLSSRLAQAIGEDEGFDRRIAMRVAAERSITALKYSRRVAKAFSARSRADGSLPVEHLFQTGDQVYYWRGVTKAKSQWAHRWMGPAIVIGTEHNNLWLSHRGNVVKCAARHVRPAEAEELVPWDDILGNHHQIFEDKDKKYEDLTPAGQTHQRSSSQPDPEDWPMTSERLC